MKTKSPSARSRARAGAESQKQEPLTISRQDARKLVRLLGILQEHLESAIESSIPPGAKDPDDPADQVNVNIDRRNWRKAEDFVSRFDGYARRGRLRPGHREDGQ